MTEAKTWPSWSRLIRVATGVFGLKNSVQLAAMSFAAELPAAADGDADAAEGDAEVGAADGLGAELLAAELPLPLLPGQRDQHRPRRPELSGRVACEPAFRPSSVHGDERFPGAASQTPSLSLAWAPLLGCWHGLQLGGIVVTLSVLPGGARPPGLVQFGSSSPIRERACPASGRRG